MPMTNRYVLWTRFTLGGIKYKKSTIQNQTIIQKYFFFTNGSPKAQDEEPACLKNGVFFKTSQLDHGGFAYI
jgi:hypothetical protein